MGTAIKLAVAGALFAVLAGCSGLQPQEPSLDGWPLGTEIRCPFVGAGEEERDGVAIAAGTIGAAPGAIEETRCYSEGGWIRHGKPFLTNRSGGSFVVVFTLDDGSRRAVGIGCNVGGCGAEHQPALW